MRSAREHEFEQFVRAHRAALVRTATTLTAGDRHLAEDLVQAALVNVYVAWPRVRTMNAPAYARRAVVNGLVDHHRRSSTRHEVSADAPPDTEDTWPVATTLTPGPLHRALARLPVGMRVAVVLRHVDGLSVEETADALGCSVGTAKSQTSRGLEKLRTLLAEHTTGVGTCPT